MNKMQSIDSGRSATETWVHVKCPWLPITGFSNTGLTYLEKRVKHRQITPIREEIVYVLGKPWQESGP